MEKLLSSITTIPYNKNIYPEWESNNVQKYECKKDEGDKLSIMTWNVNGVRKNILKASSTTLKLDNISITDFDDSVGIGEILKDRHLDIICLQENKCPHELLDKAFNIEGWEGLFVDNIDGRRNKRSPKSYSGCSLLYRKELGEPIKTNKRFFGYERDQGRIITAQWKKFTIINVYVPFGSDINTEYCKDHFYDKLASILAQVNNVGILCGDLNIIRSIYDMSPSKSIDQDPFLTDKQFMEKYKCGYRSDKRHFMDRIIDMGYIDVWRSLNPFKKWCGYTYKDNIDPSFKTRIDYFMVSGPDSSFRIENCEVGNYNKTYSDHIPLFMTISI